MLHHPALVPIIRDNGQTTDIEVFPVYTRYGDRFIATDTFRFFEGSRAEDAAGAVEDGMARYLNYIGSSNANLNSLGELRFTGDTLYEWTYTGTSLSQDEVLQLLDYLQARQPTLIEGRGFETAIVFHHDNFFVRALIKLITADGHFLIFINQRFAAKLSLAGDDWKVTLGTLSDKGLLAAVLRRIKSYVAKG